MYSFLHFWIIFGLLITSVNQHFGLDKRRNKRCSKHD